MKITSIILALIFLAFAALQYNDPDPWLWIVIYGYVALIPILYLFKVYPVRLILISIVAGLIYSFFYIPGVLDWLQHGTPQELAQEMKATKPYIEESREFLGLLIALSALLFYYFKERKLGYPKV
ncbi:hypothetical protein GCM10009122_51330 [Fulvivirga kasyanovii]|uniref:Transmembrane family 220 protein n=1 Tax=Fulvivirga kasyanovii TaxID=396812 RepID=A0ABW9RYI0_9BACT|nr:transmembrane 220 family protein [Fulvivirga kasyanovii]MTI28855.1 hypothetical protein [Fulvivirga kasyanovii]